MSSLTYCKDCVYWDITHAGTGIDDCDSLVL